MKKSRFIKLISVVLSVVMLICAVPLTSLAAIYEQSPVIYIGGMSDNILYQNPNKLNSREIYNIYSKDFLKKLANIGAAFLVASFKNVKSALPAVLESVNSIMSPIAFSEKGEPKSSKTGPWIYRDSVSHHTEDEIYTDNIKALVQAGGEDITGDDIYWFSYDWRLSSVENAEKLRDFIDEVEVFTEKSKVSLLAASNGGVIANTYLYEYREHARQNISSCVFFDAPLLGNALIGDLMAGKLAKTLRDDNSLFGKIETITGEQRGDAFFNYMESDPMGIIQEMFDMIIGEGPESILINAIFKIILLEVLRGEDIHKKFGRAYNEFVLIADETVYAECLAEYIRYIPGLWALVPEKDFEDAKKFLFDDRDVIIESELEKKIEEARKAQNHTEETLKIACMDGINVNVVASYGVAILPATVSMNDISDGIQSVKYASAGAYTKDCGKTTEWPFGPSCTSHMHTSPDGDIDASYCVLPDNTWFINGLKHNSFGYNENLKDTTGTVAEFIIWLLSGSTQRNVFMNSDYTQYLICNKYSHKIKPYSDPDDPQSEFLIGDPDMDGMVSAADARITLRTSVDLEGNPSKIYRVIMDVDGDGNVTSADARLILRYSVDLENSFPAQ